MKKIISLLLVLSTVFTLTACESKKAIAVKDAINNLNEHSSYEEINSVYWQFHALSNGQKKQVDNIDTLSEYINPENGHLNINSYTVNSEAKKKIQNYSSRGSIGFSSLDTALTLKASIENQSISQVSVSQEEFKDDYTYVISGRASCKDKYGNSTIRNFDVTLYAVVNSEASNGYSVKQEIILYK